MKQETAMAENDFLAAVITQHNKRPNFHIPGKYTGITNGTMLKHDSSKTIETVTMKDIIKPYEGISEYLVQKIYLNFYR